MEKLDLYKVLEVSKEASQDEIRRSYRRLARKYHPDANPGDKKAEDRFKEIQHAYEILSKPEKRREYDEGPRTFFGSGRNRAARRRRLRRLLRPAGRLRQPRGCFWTHHYHPENPGQRREHNRKRQVEFQRCVERCNDAGGGARGGGVRRVRGHGGGSRDGAADVSGVWWQGGAEPGPGVFRALDAVFRVWGRG